MVSLQAADPAGITACRHGSPKNPGRTLHREKHWDLPRRGSREGGHEVRVPHAVRGLRGGVHEAESISDRSLQARRWFSSVPIPLRAIAGSEGCVNQQITPLRCVGPVVQRPARRGKVRRNESSRRTTGPLILTGSTLWFGAKAAKLRWKHARCLAECFHQVVCDLVVQAITFDGWVVREVERSRIYEVQAPGFARVRLTRAQAMFIGSQLAKFPRVVAG